MAEDKAVWTAEEIETAIIEVLFKNGGKRMSGENWFILLEKELRLDKEVRE